MHLLSMYISLSVCGPYELGWFTDSGAWNKEDSACCFCGMHWRYDWWSTQRGAEQAIDALPLDCSQGVEMEKKGGSL